MLTIASEFSDALPGLILLAVIVLMGGYAVYESRQAAKRRAELAAVAQELGLRFRPGPQGRPMDLHYTRYPLFSRGRNQTLKNIMEGKVRVGVFEAHAVAGDFKYTTGYGRNRKVHKLSFAIVALPFYGLPKLTIRRETVADRMKAALGFDDINFESEEFSRRFYVSCTDKKFAYDIITPAMMEFLLKIQDPPPLEMYRGSFLIAGGSPQRWRPETFRRRLGYIGRFVELWPDHVVRLLHGGPERIQRQ